MTLWALDVDGLANAIREVNGLSGDTGRLADRMFLLGESSVNGARMAVILGLFDGDGGDLFALQEQSSRSYEQFLVLCPSYRPGPDVARRLEASEIHLRQLQEDFVIDWSAVRRNRPTVPVVVPSEQEETEFERMGACSRLPLRFTGRRERAQNIVQANGQPSPLQLRPFRLLMRLAVAVFEEPQGWVERGTLLRGGGLVAEGYYAVASIDKVPNQLRTALRSMLNPGRPENIIEVRDKRIRLSTHPAYVSWDSEMLQLHPDVRVRMLASRLDEANQRRAGGAPVSRGHGKRPRDAQSQPGP